jgi:hypothetical protein
MCRYKKYGKLLLASIPSNTYNIQLYLQKTLKYLQDTYKIPTGYLQIPTKTLRVNMPICRYVHVGICR